MCCLSALLYKCEAQRSSCGQCLKAPTAFECGWCTESRKCLLRQHCPSPEQNWMHYTRHNLRCSHPRITKVGNQTCDLHAAGLSVHCNQYWKPSSNDRKQPTINEFTHFGLILHFCHYVQLCGRTRPLLNTTQCCLSQRVPEH